MQASSLTASTLDFGLDGDAWSWAGPEGVRNLHYKQYMAAKQRLRDRQPYWIQVGGDTAPLTHGYTHKPRTVPAVAQLLFGCAHAWVPISRPDPPHPAPPPCRTLAPGWA